MTILNNPVHRLTRGSYSVLYPRPRQIVVSLEVNDIITFREKGRKARFALPVDSAFRIAVRNAALAAKREKKLNRSQS